MILPWLLYSCVVTLLLAIAARLLEPVTRQRGWPVRGLWVMALVGSILLPLLLSMPPRAAAPSAAGVVAPPPRAEPDQAATRPEWLEWTVPPASVPVAPRGASLDGWILGAWGLASSIVALGFATSYFALLRRRRAWALRDVDGRTVWVAASVGPAVVGFLPGRIVLPRWLLSAAADERAMALAHEEEHIRARDAGLLFGAFLVVVALPWNLAIWWIWRSLRRAVEIDCDRRVLGRGVDPRAYGRLLVHVMERGSPHRLVLAALSESTSFLERRVELMLAPRPRSWSPRAAVALLLSGGCVLAACQVEQPRSPVPATGTTYTVEPDGSLSKAPDPAPAAAPAAPVRAETPSLVPGGSVPASGADPLSIPAMLKVAVERYFPNLLTQNLGPNGASLYLVGDARGELVRTAIDTEQRSGGCMEILQDRLGPMDRNQIASGGCGTLAPGEAGPNRIAVFWAALKPRPGEEDATPTGPFLFTAAGQRGRPTESALRAAIERHHPDALDVGLPYGEALWFVADRGGRVLHTGRGLGYGSSPAANLDLERMLPGVRIGPVLMSSSVKDAGGKGIDLVWGTVEEPGEAAAPSPALPPYAYVRTFVVTSPAAEQEVTIRLEGPVATNPNAFRVSGSFTRDGEMLRGRTPFTLVVVTDQPFVASLSGGSEEMEIATRWEGRESRLRANGGALVRREEAGGPIVVEATRVRAMRVPRLDLARLLP